MGWGLPPQEYPPPFLLNKKVNSMERLYINKKPNATILDACCGGRMFYFDKEDERVVFQDIRCEDVTLSDGKIFKVRPDIVADFRNMPWPDNTFQLVVFDPPHMVYYSRSNSGHEKKGDMYAKYGELRKDWRECIEQGFRECFRVLKRGGGAHI